MWTALPSEDPGNTESAYSSKDGLLKITDMWIINSKECIIKHSDIF